MSRPLDAHRLMQQLASASDPALVPLYILTGDETLLVNECADAVRAAADRAGYSERVGLTLDARGDWSSLTSATQTVSLFGERRLITVSIPSGRPGRQGGETLQSLAATVQRQATGDVIVLVVLPRLDRATRASKWAQALLSAGTHIDIPNVDRTHLPAWIRERLARQGQTTDEASLEWMADRVEGNLLAAFQEVQKLGLLYPEGTIAAADIEQAVLNVARYNVFGLRDAMLAGDAPRTLSTLAGLQAEGEALPLVLWAIGDEIRVLARLAVAQGKGRLREELQRQRIFAARQNLVRQALNRVPAHLWPSAVQHAHDIDRLIKGLKPAGRMEQPWAELARLALRIALAGTPRSAVPA